MKYLDFYFLGLPLSNKKPPKHAYQLMLDSIQSRLSGWKGDKLSIGGWVLTNVFLTFTPIYFMSCFMLSKWVIKRIDKIHRRFLWHGHKEPLNQSNSIFLAHRELVTRSKELGGLGIRDLHITNTSLMIIWMWYWLEQQDVWWKQTTITPAQHIRPWDMNNASRFWKDTTILKNIFHSIVKFQIGQGDKTQFWHENWAQRYFKI
jgi:hypothetical protein